ncbi:response regulator [Rhizobium tubonense]|uniref:Response regulator n=1 Tax=Rhizobium tubonense TaxID=484088 RepID=A0A2W4CXZ5_9HYPH|nr:response regulator [Rhizobium tubonense]PZM16301.1 response regulator [Rhizobium tubonense]
MRILLVEDNILIGNAVRDHVAADGWEVDWATDLMMATKAVDQTRYAVILLDLRLPDGSGLDLLRHLRNGSRLMPVIILSAYDQISDQIEALRIGAVDYLVKPFDLSELISRISRIATPFKLNPSIDRPDVPAVEVSCRHPFAPPLA